MDGNVINSMIFGGNIVKSILECRKLLPDRGISNALCSLMNVQKTEIFCHRTTLLCGFWRDYDA